MSEVGTGDRGAASGRDITDANIATGDHNRIQRGAAVDGNIRVSQKLSSHDLFSAVLARLEVFDHRFEILNNRLIELVGMRRDIDDIRQAVRGMADVEPKILALEQKVAFHINLLWIVMAVLMVGLALLWLGR